MSDEVVQAGPDRPTSRAHFHARVSRYANLLREKWWVLVAGAIVGSAVMAGLVWFAPPSFVSFGRMIVSVRLNIAEGSVYTEELSNFLGTQAALMQSGAVVGRAHGRVTAQKPNLAMRPVELRVTVLPKTTIFVLQAVGDDPDYTQTFLQACMEEYIALKRDMRAQTSDTTLAGLTEEVVRLEKELRKSDEELVEFQATNSVVLSQDQGNSAANYLTALNQRLAGLRSEHELLGALTLDQSLDRQQEAGSPLPVVAGATDGTAGTAAQRTDPDYLKAKQQLLLLQAEQQEMGRYLRTNHPKMVAMSEEIARREQLLKIFRAQSAEQLESRKASLALEIQNLEKSVKDWDAKALDLQAKTAQYQRLKANSQRIQALYDRLLATMQTLDVNKEVTPESVTIMEKAAPARPNRPDLLQRTVVGAVIGLALGIALLLLVDKLDDRMGSFTELQGLFDEEVVGQVPREKSLSSKRRASLIEVDDERHAFVEAYRNLRSSLLYMAETGERPKTILVTSSVPNDGKSVTAANLAITLASGGCRVLLVDADLRKGTLQERFGVPAEPGLAEALSGAGGWEAAVHPSKYANLFVLPAGAFTANSSELFLGEATKEFLQGAAATYDYVILDTVPVMAADDVTSLAPQVDGVLFVIRAVYTSARVARASLDALYQRRVRLLGLVFNAVPPTSVEYYYYHKYKSYYRPYPSARAGAGHEEQAGKA